MIEKTAEICTHILQVIVSPWRHVPIRIQGIVLVGLPLLAVAISAALALFGNHQRVGRTTCLTRIFKKRNGRKSCYLLTAANAPQGLFFLDTSWASCLAGLSGTQATRHLPHAG